MPGMSPDDSALAGALCAEKRAESGLAADVPAETEAPVVRRPERFGIRAELGSQELEAPEGRELCSVNSPGETLPTAPAGIPDGILEVLAVPISEGEKVHLCPEALEESSGRESFAMSADRGVFPGAGSRLEAQNPEAPAFPAEPVGILEPLSPAILHVGGAGVPESGSGKSTAATPRLLAEVPVGSAMTSSRPEPIPAALYAQRTAAPAGASAEVAVATAEVLRTAMGTGSQRRPLSSARVHEAIELASAGVGSPGKPSRMAETVPAENPSRSGKDPIGRDREAFLGTFRMGSSLRGGTAQMTADLPQDESGKTAPVRIVFPAEDLPAPSGLDAVATAQSRLEMDRVQVADPPPARPRGGEAFEPPQPGLTSAARPDPVPAFSGLTIVADSPPGVREGRSPSAGGEAIAPRNDVEAVSWGIAGLASLAKVPGEELRGASSASFPVPNDAQPNRGTGTSRGVWGRMTLSGEVAEQRPSPGDWPGVEPQVRDLQQAVEPGRGFRRASASWTLADELGIHSVEVKTSGSGARGEAAVDRPSRLGAPDSTFAMADPVVSSHTPAEGHVPQHVRDRSDSVVSRAEQDGRQHRVEPLCEADPREAAETRPAGTGNATPSAPRETHGVKAERQAAEGGTEVPDQPVTEMGADDQPRAQSQGPVEKREAAKSHPQLRSSSADGSVREARAPADFGRPVVGLDSARETRPTARGGNQAFPRLDWPQLSHQVRPALQRIVAQGSAEVVVHLRPPELGRLRIEVKSEAGEVTVRLEADVDATRQLLSERAGELEKALAGQGHHVVRLEVHAPQPGGPGLEDAPDRRPRPEPQEREARAFRRHEPEGDKGQGSGQSGHGQGWIA